MPIRDNQRKLEKRIESLVVNWQFSESVGELVLDPDVHHHVSDFFSEIWRSDILHWNSVANHPEFHLRKTRNVTKHKYFTLEKRFHISFTVFFASKVSHPDENGLIVAKIVFVVLSSFSFFFFFLPSVCLTIDARVCCVATMPRIANTSDKQLKSSSSRSRRKPGEREWERTREGVREH